MPAPGAVPDEVAAALIHGESLYLTFLEQSPVGIVHVDSEGVVTFENHRLRQIIGEGPEDAWIGRKLSEIPAVGSRVGSLLREMIDKGEPFVEESDFHPPGEVDSLAISLNGSPIRHPEAGIIGGVILVFDVTAQRELETRARYDEVESSLRNAALSLPSEHAFLDEAARILGEAGGVDHVFVLFCSEDADAYEEEVRWTREAERSLIPLRLPADDLVALTGTSGMLHLRRPAAQAVGHAAGSLLTMLGADEVMGLPFETSSDRRGCLLLVRASAGESWTAAERNALARQGALFATLWSWMRAEALYRQAIATVDDCLFSYSFAADGRRDFTFVTTQIEALTGVTVSSLLAGEVDWVADLIHEEDAAAVAAFERQLREGKEGRLVYRILNRRGETRWLRESATPSRDSVGCLTIGGLFSDITDEKDVEASLVQAKLEAEAANRMKSTFLATMSHELRTPLGAIKGFADLLDEEIAAVDGLPIEVAEFSGVIRANADRVLGLVTDLLDLARLQTERLTLEDAPVAINPLISGMTAKYGPACEEKNVQFHADLSEEEPIARADTRRLEQVVDALVSNACKFTQTGTITLSTRLAGAMVEIRVADTGIGIDEDYLPELFEPFTQEDNQLNRSFEGSGLGLALTRRLVEAMGGSIDVTSTKGYGSTFTVTLHRADA